MSKRIEVSKKAFHDQMMAVMRKFHKSLVEVDVAVVILLVWAPCDEHGDPTGPALTHHGAAAFAKVKRLSAEDRAMTRMGAAPKFTGVDVRMEIDAARFESLRKAQQDALFDHELEHLFLKEDANGCIQRHDDGRPKVFLRPDGWQINGFEAVTRRHGKDSIEFFTLSSVVENILQGQLKFAFMDTPSAKSEGAPSKGKRRGRKATKKKGGSGVHRATNEETRDLKVRRAAAKLRKGVEKMPEGNSLTIRAGGELVTIEGKGRRRAAASQ